MAAPSAFPNAIDPSSPDASAGAPPADAGQPDLGDLAADTQKPSFDVPDEALEQYGLGQAQVGDKVRAQDVVFTITAKTPGSEAVGDQATSGSTTLSVESIGSVSDEADTDDMSDENTPAGGPDGNPATSPKDPAALQDEPGGELPSSNKGSALGFDPKKASRSKSISPKEAGFRK